MRRHDAHTVAAAAAAAAAAAVAAVAAASRAVASSSAAVVAIAPCQRDAESHQARRWRQKLVGFPPPDERRADASTVSAIATDAVRHAASTVGAHRWLVTGVGAAVLYRVKRCW